MTTDPRTSSAVTLLVWYQDSTRIKSSVLLCWPCDHAIYHIITHRRVCCGLKINIWYFSICQEWGLNWLILYIQVKTLKEQLEQKKKGHKRDKSCSPEGEVLENSTDPDVMDMHSETHTHTEWLLSLQVDATIKWTWLKET